MVRPGPDVQSSDPKYRSPGRAWLAAALFLAAAALGCRGSQPAAVLPSRSEGAVEIRLECAATPEKRERGLMFRPRLGEREGMLFILTKEDTLSFWMKNTYVSLDLFFLDKDGRVVDLAERLKPCPADPCPVYASSAPCRYALEVAAGTAFRHGIRKGDRIDLRLPRGTDCSPR